MAGYAGKVAFVDLTSGSVTKESLPEQVYRRFIGGAGLGAKILYDRMKAGIDPLGPENMLGFLPGLLNGTGTPMATKYTVVTKSPLSYTWGDANSGGLLQLGAEGCGLRWDILHGYCVQTGLPVDQRRHYRNQEWRPPLGEKYA